MAEVQGQAAFYFALLPISLACWNKLLTASLGSETTELICMEVQDLALDTHSYETNQDKVRAQEQDETSLYSRYGQP